MGTHNLYSLGAEQRLRVRINTTVNDHDARNFILRTGRRVDLSEPLGDAWAGSWTDPELRSLASLSQAERQDHIVARVRAFLGDPSVMAARVHQAASQTADLDLQLQAQVAQAVGSQLLRFNWDILIRTQSVFTGKVRYVPLTDLDVETGAVIIEVTTQADAGGKVTQLGVLRSVAANPASKPVIHFMPNATAGAELALRHHGSHAVCRTLAALLATLKAIP